MNNVIDICEQVKTIVKKRVGDQEKVKALNNETPLLSLGIDSILALSILVDIEEFFDIEIDDSDLNMDKIKTVVSFAELVQDYIKRAS